VGARQYDADSEAGRCYRHYLDRGRETTESSGYPYTEYRAGMRLLVQDWLDEGRGELDLRLTLTRLHYRDLVWTWRAHLNQTDVVEQLGVCWWQRVVLLAAPLREEGMGGEKP